MPHQRATEFAEVPRVFLDYYFLSPRGELLSKDAIGNNSEKKYTIIAAMVDQSSGACVATQVLRKGGNDNYGSSCLASWLERLGHKRVVLQTDNEKAIRSFAQLIRKKCSADVILRVSPVYSSVSLASGETIQGIVA